MITKILLLLMSIYLSDAQSCTLPSGCTQSSNNVTCAGISEMPSCFPAGTTIVRIAGSISKLDDDTIPTNSRQEIAHFTLISNELKSVDDEAFSAMTSLTHLQLSSPRLDELEFSSSGSPGNLEELILTGNTELDTLNGLGNMKKLKIIDLTLCDFRKIHDSTFRGLTNLEELWLHKNFYLYSISSDAFNDLTSLKILHLDSCRFDALYPEYFKVPFESGSLQEVNTIGNPFKCSKMCEMSHWLNENPTFNDIATIGGCYYYGTKYLIKLLDDNLAGCGLGGWAIFGICIACVVALALVIAGVQLLITKRKMKKSRQRREQQGQEVLHDVEESHATAYSQPAGYGGYPASSSSVDAKAAEANKPPPTYDDLQH